MRVKYNAQRTHLVVVGSVILPVDGCRPPGPLQVLYTDAKLGEDYAVAPLCDVPVYGVTCPYAPTYLFRGDCTYVAEIQYLLEPFQDELLNSPGNILMPLPGREPRRLFTKPDHPAVVFVQYYD